MARKYRRSSNGQFAGGGGTTAGAKRKNSVASAHRMAAAARQKQRVIAKNGSKGVAAGKVTARKAKGGKLKAVGTFARKHPRLVAGVATVAVHVAADRAAGALDRRDARIDSKIYGAAKRYAESTIANKRGISGPPGSGLKAAKRSPRGAYKIRSK